MFKIRQGCFETNSSSMHSIVMMKQRKNTEDYFKCMLDNDGKLKIWSDYDLNFGRSPFEILCTFERKLCYAIASLGKRYFNECEEIAKKYAKNIVRSYKYNQDDPIDCTGIKLPRAYGYANDEKQYYGDVDHQSVGVLTSFLSKHDLTLEQFLADPRYVVIIDGDEYCVFDTMLEIGLIDKNNLKQ